MERRFNITPKADNTLVTAADIFLENLIFNYIKTQIPNVKYIGEESFEFSQFYNEEYVVILDPIDGTENFCSGLKEWGISFGELLDATQKYRVDIRARYENEN